MIKDNKILETEMFQKTWKEGYKINYRKIKRNTS